MEKRFTKEMVDDYAEKLLMGLTPEENKMVLDEFEIIDHDIDKINAIPGLKDVEPMSWCLDRDITSLREDECIDSISIEEALSNCDENDGAQVEVPKVV